MQASEGDVRVGDRRLRAAGGVGRGAGVRPCAQRADVQQPALVDPGDRPPAGADRPDRHARHRHRDPERDVELGGVLDLAVQDEADVAARAAHVEREERPAARRAGVELRTDDPAGQTREDDLRGPALGGGGAHAAAVGAQEMPAIAGQSRAEHRSDAGDVFLDDRLDERVGDRRARPLVLAPHRADLVADRHGGVRQDVADDGGHDPLVLGAQIGEEQADGDRQRFTGVSIAEPDQRLAQRGEAVGVERFGDLAAMVDAAGDADAVPPAHERARLDPVQVVEPLLVEPSDERNVGEALIGHVGDRRPLALDDRVDGDGGADDRALHVAREVQSGEAAGDRPRRIARDRRAPWRRPADPSPRRARRSR